MGKYHQFLTAIREVRQRFAYVQDTREIARLAAMVAPAEVIIEIGSREGGSLCVLSRALVPGGLIIGVDLPGVLGKWGIPGSASHLAESAELVRKDGHRCEIIIGDSHDEATLVRVREILGEDTLADLVFIDGDHTLEGVREDWRMYGHLGRVVAFHDINEYGGQMAVQTFWRELREEHPSRCREMIQNSGSKLLGIGVIEQAEE